MRTRKWFHNPIYVRVDLTQPGVAELRDAIRDKAREQIPENRPSININRSRTVAWVKLDEWSGLPRIPAITHVLRDNRGALREIQEAADGWYPDPPPPRPKPEPPPVIEESP